MVQWCGDVLVWWCGGVVVWWCGGVVVWWCGVVVKSYNRIRAHRWLALEEHHAELSRSPQEQQP